MKIISLSSLENIVHIIQSLVMAMAIIVGGGWSYLLFIRKRQSYPYAKIEQHITHRLVAKNYFLLSIDITISNMSDVLLSLSEWEIEIKQILPPMAELGRIMSGETSYTPGFRIIEWHSIVPRTKEQEKERNRVKYEIEPREQEQIHADFLINSYVQTILVESYFKNIKKRKKERGWYLTTMYDLQPLYSRKGEKNANHQTNTRCPEPQRKNSKFWAT